MNKLAFELGVKAAAGPMPVLPPVVLPGSPPMQRTTLGQRFRNTLTMPGRLVGEGVNAIKYLRENTNWGIPGQMIAPTYSGLRAASGKPYTYRTAVEQVAKRQQEHPIAPQYRQNLQALGKPARVLRVEPDMMPAGLGGAAVNSRVLRGAMLPKGAAPYIVAHEATHLAQPSPVLPQGSNVGDMLAGRDRETALSAYQLVPQEVQAYMSDLRRAWQRRTGKGMETPADAEAALQWIRGQQPAAQGNPMQRAWRALRRQEPAPTAGQSMPTGSNWEQMETLQPTINKYQQYFSPEMMREMLLQTTMAPRQATGYKMAGLGMNKWAFELGKRAAATGETGALTAARHVFKTTGRRGKKGSERVYAAGNNGYQVEIDTDDGTDETAIIDVAHKPDGRPSAKLRGFHVL